MLEVDLRRPLLVIGMTSVGDMAKGHPQLRESLRQLKKEFPSSPQFFQGYGTMSISSEQLQREITSKMIEQLAECGLKLEAWTGPLSQQIGKPAIFTYSERARAQPEFAGASNLRYTFYGDRICLLIPLERLAQVCPVTIQSVQDLADWIRNLSSQECNALLVQCMPVVATIPASSLLVVPPGFFLVEQSLNRSSVAGVRVCTKAAAAWSGEQQMAADALMKLTPQQAKVIKQIMDVEARAY